MIIDKNNKAASMILAASSFKDRAVLEIGCGDGRLSKDLYHLAAHYIAIDPDHEAIVQARSHSPEADFRVGSGETLDFPDHSFDIVLFTLSLHHQDCSRALHEAARVVNQDGTILVLEPSPESEVSIICNVFKDETAELNRATAAVGSSGLQLVSQHDFITLWECESALELYEWLRDFYQTDCDELKTGHVNTILGTRIHRRPLLLEDTLVLTVLRK